MEFLKFGFELQGLFLELLTFSLFVFVLGDIMGFNLFNTSFESLITAFDFDYCHSKALLYPPKVFSSICDLEL